MIAGIEVDGIIAYIGIGSNLDDPLLQCQKGLQRLTGLTGVTLERIASFYKTEPVTDTLPGQAEKSQAWFVNTVAEIRTVLSPRGILEALQSIEEEMGRRRSYRGAPRTIDLDLLLYGQQVMRETDLIVPHPRMHERRFVLEPMCEIASYVIHPGFGVSMKGLLDRLTDSKAVVRL